MGIPDAHCHLDQLPDPDAAVDRARRAGVTALLAVSEDASSGRAVLDLQARHAGIVYAGIGLHPMHSVRLSEAEVERECVFVEEHLSEACALGEVGLDYKHAVTEEARAFQHALLDRLLAAAAAARKPVNLHSRRAQRPVMERAVRFHRETGLPALLHWFTASKKLLRTCAEEGLYVSAGPSVLFDAHALDVACRIPESLLLVETDSPVPFGGAPAEPAWAARVAGALARAKGVPPETLAARVEENFRQYLSP